MKYVERKLGSHNAFAKYYLQEPNKEIDINRVYPTMVICPGGAYLWTSFREDEPIALRFLAEGFHVVVVHYATEGLEFYQDLDFENINAVPVSVFPNSLIELAEAISYLRENAKKYAVNTDEITVGGFSAGGHLSSQLGVYWNEDWLEKLVGKSKALYKPNKLMLAYPAIDLSPKKADELPSKILLAVTGKGNPSQKELDLLNSNIHVNKTTPPTFLWHTVKDPLVSVMGTVKFGEELIKKGIPVEMHIFNEGKHGLGLGDLRTGRKKDQINAQVYKWVDLFLEWVKPIKSNLNSFYEGIDNNHKNNSN